MGTFQSSLATRPEGFQLHRTLSLCLRQSSGLPYPNVVLDQGLAGQEEYAPTRPPLRAETSIHVHLSSRAQESAVNRMRILHHPHSQRTPSPFESNSQLTNVCCTSLVFFNQQFPPPKTYSPDPSSTYSYNSPLHNYSHYASPRPPHYCYS